MKQLTKKFFFSILVTALFAPVALLAQDDKDKDKEKESKAKKEGEQIIITRKGDKDQKTVIELQGDKVIVNGKEVKEGDDDDDVTVRRHKIKDVWAFDADNFRGGWNNFGETFNMFNVDENKAMLGVTTEQADNGVEIQSVTKESAAEKAGLKKGDVITKIGDKKIESPDELSETIRDHKPGDKVSVTFLRDKKEQKVSAELGKYKGVKAFTMPQGQNFNFDLGDLGGTHAIPKITAPGMNWNWSGGGPKLGVSVQDTEDGKGVNVIDVHEDGNAAKAGIKEDDIITEVDGKTVNSADEIAKLIKESRDKTSVKIKLLRKGKAETVEVKIPKKLKSADL